MVIITGKAFWTINQKMFFSFSAEKRWSFSFSFQFRKKKKRFFGCFYFSTEKGKLIFGRPIIYNFLLLFNSNCMTLTFDLVTPKVDRFMSLTCGPLVPICIKIGSFIFKIMYSQVCRVRTLQTM